MSVNIARFKVLHVAEALRGGIATYLREMLPLQVTRYGAGSIAVAAPADQIADLGEQPGVVLFSVRRSTLRPLTAFRLRRQIDRINKDLDGCIIHVHSTFAGVACRLRTKAHLRKNRVVYCPHGWAFDRGGKWAGLAARIERILLARSTRVICVSQAERDSALARGLSGHKLVVIHNGLPDDNNIPASSFYDGWDPEALRLVFVGRLDRQKGFDVLVRAISSLRRPINVHVFGDYVLRDARASEIPDNFKLHGWQSFREIAPYLASCDALVMPSRWEGLPLTALEAMRAGKAVIGSRIGGITELIEDGVTGLLVNPDNASELASAIDGISQDRLSEMGARGRQRFLAKFLIEECELRLSEAYNL